MHLKIINSKQKDQYNKLASHVMQSWEWGEFRKSLGIPTLRFGLFQDNKLSKVFQLFLHKIPLTNFFVGYLPKGPYPDWELTEALSQIGRENHCAFIKIEPNIEKSGANFEIDQSLKPSSKPLFTKYNYVLDLTKSDEEILQNMHPKFRYNIRVAQKHGVKIETRTDDEAFEIYLKLHFETTKRQGFHSHTPFYHQKIWETLKKSGMAKILIAFYQPPNANTALPINAWMLFIFKDTLYYPYGGSSTEYKQVMAPNLTAWEAVKLGKKLGLKKLDLWGALGPKASPNNPWQGFSQFKAKLGAELVEYIGTYDLVFNSPLYWLFTTVDKLTPLKLFLLNLLNQKTK